MLYGYRVFFWGEKNVLELGGGTGEKQWKVLNGSDSFKMVIACQFHLSTKKLGR
jgi:hypothetical protein